MQKTWPEFELGTPIPISISITIMLCAHPMKYHLEAISLKYEIAMSIAECTINGRNWLQRNDLLKACLVCAYEQESRDGLLMHSTG